MREAARPGDRREADAAQERLLRAEAKNSAFYETTLDLLLAHIGAETLIVTGLLGNSCVLFTAHDAYLRDYKLIVPGDCTASVDPEDNDLALRQMSRVLKTDISPWRSLTLRK